MDSMETVGALDLQRRGLSPLGVTARCHTRRLVVIVLLMATVVVVAVRNPGPLLPTVGVLTTIVGVGGPTFLVRLELDALVDTLIASVSLVALIDCDPAADLRVISGWLALAAAGFLVEIAAAWQFASGLVDVLAEWGRVTADSRQSTLELELFFPVAVGGSAAVAPLLFGLCHVGVLPRRFTGRTRGLSLLRLAVFAVCFSLPDSTAFALYAAPSAVGLGVAVTWVELG